MSDLPPPAYLPTVGNEPVVRDVLRLMGAVWVLSLSSFGGSVIGVVLAVVQETPAICWVYLLTMLLSCLSAALVLTVSRLLTFYELSVARHYEVADEIEECRAAFEGWQDDADVIARRRVIEYEPTEN